MFGIDQKVLIESLCKISAKLCSYIRKPCDCKYISDGDTMNNIVSGSESGSGCPEAMLAAILFNHMTHLEFLELAKRANIILPLDIGNVSPNLNIHQLIDQHQNERFKPVKSEIKKSRKISK